jgi:hypothetical protein
MNYDYMTEEELISMGEEATNPMDYQPDIKSDMVNHPPHYTSGNIECIDAMQAASTGDEFKAFCRLNAMKYIWRAGKKWDYREDINKAIWYLEQIVK